MTYTTAQIARVATDWTKIAEENVKVEVIGGAFYGWCSELASLRLFKKYNLVTNTGKARAEYSANRKTYYFVLEV